MQPLRKTAWEFLRKLRIELLCDSAIPLLGTYKKNMKTLTLKNIYTPMFIMALFIIA